MITCRTVEQALHALADAIWWFKGFAAGRPADIDPSSGDHIDLENKIREIRIWLGRLTEGKVRRLGDEKVVVLTYGEFEILHDGLRPPYGVPDIDEAIQKEREKASSVAARILREYAHEAASQTDPNAPF